MQYSALYISTYAVLSNTNTVLYLVQYIVAQYTNTYSHTALLQYTLRAKWPFWPVGRPKTTGAPREMAILPFREGIIEEHLGRNGHEGHFGGDFA